MDNLIHVLKTSLSSTLQNQNYTLEPLFEENLEEEKHLISCYVHSEGNKILLFELHLADSFYCKETNNFCFESDFYLNKTDSKLGVFYFDDISEIHKFIKKAAKEFTSKKVV